MIYTAAMIYALLLGVPKDAQGWTFEPPHRQVHAHAKSNLRCHAEYTQGQRPSKTLMFGYIRRSAADTYSMATLVVAWGCAYPRLLTDMHTPLTYIFATSNSM